MPEPLKIVKATCPDCSTPIFVLASSSTAEFVDGEHYEALPQTALVETGSSRWEFTSVHPRHRCVRLNNP